MSLALFGDILGYLASASYVLGDTFRAGMKQAKIEKREKELMREVDLFLAFRRDDGGGVGLALGRPYRHVYPEYLRERLERAGKTEAEIDAAEWKWLTRSEAGINRYIARREGRYFAIDDREILAVADRLEEQQERYMAIYKEAMDRYPHYAVRQFCVEQYPSKLEYFAAIEEYRTGEGADLEPIFGVSPPSDDPDYDAEVRRLFYAIDADGAYGLDLEDRYHVMQFLRYFRYHGAGWPKIVRYYAALNRILTEAGADQYDFWENSNEIGFVHGKVMTAWLARDKTTEEKLANIREIVDQETDWMENPRRYRIRVLAGMAVQTLLRKENLDPTLYKMPRK